MVVDRPAGRPLQSGWLGEQRKIALERAPAHLPYEAAELDHTTSVLAGLNGRVVTSEELVTAATELTRPMHPVLRRRDLLGLFDTAPDLSGNDIDVSPFIRDAADHTVFVAWREFPDDQVEGGAPGRVELCPAPIGDVKDMIREGRTSARVFDQRSGAGSLRVPTTSAQRR